MGAVSWAGRKKRPFPTNWASVAVSTLYDLVWDATGDLVTVAAWLDWGWTCTYDLRFCGSEGTSLAALLWCSHILSLCFTICSRKTWWQTTTADFLWSEKYAATPQALPPKHSWSRCLANIWSTSNCYDKQWTPVLSKKFAAFANQYRFDYITSSPRYPQSNGFIERMVQTVKQSMRKWAAAGDDQAMLIYRATPFTASVDSPPELLNGQKYRALLLTRSSIQNPHSQEMGGRLKLEEINS